MASNIRTLCVVILGSFFLAANGPAISEDEDSTIKNVIQHDFDGDGAYRVGKILFTRESPFVGDKCCAVPREAFLAIGDPIVITTKYLITSKNALSNSIVNYTIKFHVIMITTGAGMWPSGNKQRHFVRILPYDEQINYRVQRFHGEWKIVDPPIPRVSVFALSELMEKELKDTDNQIANLPSGYPTNGGAFAANKWIKNQMIEMKDALSEKNINIESQLSRKSPFSRSEQRM